MELPDVVIVGGGIVGICLAYELARRTLRVALRESHALAGGTTGSGFAWVNATSKDEDEAYHRLNAAGLAAYDALARDYGAENIGLHGGGSLHWVTQHSPAEARSKLLRRAEVLQAWNYPTALLHGRDIAALEPNAAMGLAEDADAAGLFAPGDRWLDTLRFVRFMAQQCRKMNVSLREYCPVTGFTRGITGKITGVRTESEGLISAPLVVLAAGLETPRLAALLGDDPQTARCVPVRGDAGLLLETPKGGALCRRVLYPADGDGLHLRPTPVGGLLIGADDTDRAVQALSGGNIPSDIPAALWNRVVQEFPPLRAQIELSQCVPRRCVRPMPADERPIVGTLPGVQGVFAAVTHSGVTLAPTLAQRLADEIIGTHIFPELAPYRPQRFLAAG